MICKFCNSLVDHLGAWGTDRGAPVCSWCKSEVPYVSKICWVCESPLRWVEGSAICGKCGQDYLVNEGKTILSKRYHVKGGNNVPNKLYQ